MPHPIRTTTVLALFAAVALGACRDPAPETTDVPIDFARSIPAFETIELDSGPVEVYEGVTLRSVTTFDASWEFAASGFARGLRVVPIEDTGEISVTGTVTVDLYATVTVPGSESDGLVGTKTFDLETNISRFDPFPIDDPKLLALDLPAEIEVRFDPASGTGFAFVIEMGFFMLPTYEGTCLEGPGPCDE